jgi:hypothetical protein
MSKAAEEWKLIGFIGVDSGHIVICDPCYLPARRMDMEEKFGVKDDPEWFDGADKNNHELHAPEFVGEFSYRGTCSTTSYFGAGQLYYKKGHAGAGVTANTVDGDGTYPVYGRLNKQGRVRALLIRLDGEDTESNDVPPRRAGLVKRAQAMEAKRERDHKKQLDTTQKGLDLVDRLENEAVEKAKVLLRKRMSGKT